MRGTPHLPSLWSMPAARICNRNAFGWIDKVNHCVLAYGLDGAQPRWSGCPAAPQPDVGMLVDAFAEPGFRELVLAHHRRARGSAFFSISVGARHHAHRLGLVRTLPRGCCVGGRLHG
jgi:hypothetical protein